MIADIALAGLCWLGAGVLAAALWALCVPRLRKRAGRLNRREEFKFGRIWRGYDREAQEPTRDGKTEGEAE